MTAPSLQVPFPQPAEVAPQFSTMPPDVQEQLTHLKDDLKKLTAAADEARKSGDDGAAQFKEMLLGDIKERIQEIEEKYPPQSAPPPSAPPPQGAPPPAPGMPGLTPPGLPGLRLLPGPPGLPPPWLPGPPGL